jgi:hypothetical protein
MASLIFAHITFCLPYVILSVMPKLRQMDPNLAEAAQDLGCTPRAAFFQGCPSGNHAGHYDRIDYGIHAFRLTTLSSVTLQAEQRRLCRFSFTR